MDDLVFDPSKPWYESATGVSSQSIPLSATKPTKGLHERAQKLLKDQIEIYQQRFRPLEREWNKSVLESGTKKDKASTQLLLVSSCPPYHLEELRQLLNMATFSSSTPGHKGIRVQVLESLADVFLTKILPENRKLVLLEHRASRAVSDRELLIWHVEDVLKRAYADFVAIVEKMTMDNLYFVKNSGLNILFTCLCKRPELENSILRVLINKIHDPEKKVSSKVVYLLKQVLIRHPLMAGILLDSVWTNVVGIPFGSKPEFLGRYYGVLFMSQIPLSDQNIATKAMSYHLKNVEMLLGYLTSLEKTRPKKKSCAETKLNKIMAIVFGGIHRALRHASINWTDDVEPIYGFINVGEWNVALRALWLLHEVLPQRPGSMDRFLQTVYETLVDHRLLTTSASKQKHYLELLDKIIQQDPNPARNASFLKRLLQACSLHEPPFVCGALILVHNIVLLRPNIMAPLYDQSEAMSPPPHCKRIYDPHCPDPRTNHASKASLYEILPFLHHYHPSVRKCAQDVIKALQSRLEGNQTVLPPIVCTDAMFESFGTNAFLARLVRKNPKDTESRPEKPPTPNLFCR